MQSPHLANHMTSNTTVSGASSEVKRTVNNVTKSPEDKHEYRAIVLNNNLRALLISDSSADRSAASVCVHAGSINESKAWEGLAHFCEHMLFLGTEKYPVEDSYSSFISEHGGKYNAYTTVDHTCYYFDIAPEHLAEAMDHFSQFFLCPLFTESATEREVQAVHSEHTKNIPLDSRRIQQLDRTLGNPQHDFGDHFFTGSRETLLPDPSVAPELRRQLLQFHANEYSANRIALAVLGNEPLDHLQEIVLATFAGVEDKALPERRWDSHPYEESQCGVKVYAVTIKDVCTLMIVFPMPELRHLYKGSPAHYLSHLIGHEGPGSVLAYLKRRGWSNALHAGGKGGGAHGFDFFRISLDLTEAGAKREDSVIAAVFRYLDLLRLAGPQEWIFNEARDLQYLAFRFKDKSRPIDLTQRLSSKLLYYPPEDVLTAMSVVTEYMPDEITELLSLLTPERCKIFIGSQAVQGKCRSTERHYGTQYGVHPLSQELLAACRGCSTASCSDCELPQDGELHLPSPNPFISTDFGLKPHAPAEAFSSSAQVASCPRIIRLDRHGRVWHRQDDEYHLPKASYTVELLSPYASTDSYSAVCSSLYFRMLADALKSLTYDAGLAGLHYSLNPSTNGAVLQFSGYNDRLPTLLKSVLDRMARPDFDPVRFVSIYDSAERSLKNYKLQQPLSHCSFNLSYISRNLVWTPEDCLEALTNVTLDSVQQFGRQLQSRLHLETLVYGNATPQDAEAVARAVLGALSPIPVPRSEVSRARSFLLPAGSHHLYRSLHSQHKDSACAVYFQIEPDAAGGFPAKIRSRVLSCLLEQVVQQGFFDSLRTKQQLGYIVAARIYPGVNMDGMLFQVQSDRHPVYLEERIDAFVDNIGEDILAMSDEQFKSHVAAFNSVITEKPRNMSSRNQIYFGEISNGTLCFDRKERMSACLTDSVTKEDLLQYYCTWLEKSSPARRRLSLHVVSEQTHGGIKEEDYASFPATNIANVVEFQRRLLLAPLPLPAALEADFFSPSAAATVPRQTLRSLP